MNRVHLQAARLAFWLSRLAPAIMTRLCLLLAASAAAQNVQHLTITEPGGMPGTPVMMGVSPATNGVKVSWFGPSGYYQLWQKYSLTGAAWLAWGGATNAACMAAVPASGGKAFFRVSGPGPDYAGDRDCGECHGAIRNSVLGTAHSRALAALQQISQDANPNCLACHTVGYGLPTGYQNESTTPLLENVQCENCHGPAGSHLANPNNLGVVPRVELAAQVCGGCHNGAEHPTFDEWNGSPHGQVVPEVAGIMASSSADISDCGRCHSGSARVKLLDGGDPTTTLTGDYDVPITCAVCHDPHAQYVHTNTLNGVVADYFSGLLFTNNQLGAVYTNQIRNPYASLITCSVSPSDSFSNVYDPGVNVCAQCHNERGAAWTDTSRSPHHSPQYNILIGSADTNLPIAQFGAHALLERQCVSCHMQSSPYVSESQPAVTGHSFEMNSYAICANCHGNVAGRVQFTTNSIATTIRQTVSYLDLWATNAAPAQLRTNYNILAWEYTTPGDLSAGGPGPSASDQALIPDDIKKARFDLYLVFYDGSFGVHNPQYVSELLSNAETLVEGQLYQ